MSLRNPGRLVALGFLLALVACSAREERLTLLPSPGDAALERQVYAAVNAYRASRRLPALEWSEVVANQARQHSRRMASGATSVGHHDFKKRAAAIGTAVAWSEAAENVASTGSTARAVELWLRQKGHRRNIEGHFDLTGIGAATTGDGWIYLTQIFVKSK